MDWSKCVICKCGGAGLKCPADSLQGNGLEVYEAFLVSVEEFRSLESLPVDVNFTEIREANIFLQNRAKWHKACRLKFAHSKLVKLQEQLKRKAENVTEDEQKSKCQSMDTSDIACIFCMESSGQLHKCSTMELDEDLRRMAMELEDTTLLARISGGDLVAIEAKYHRKCLSTYRNRHRGLERARQNTDVLDESRFLEARAFAEIVSYMESHAEDGNYMFKLSELHGMFVERLQDLGVNKTINKTRMKMHLLAQFEGELQEQSDGRNTLLVFNKGITALLQEAMKYRDFESEALLMSKIAKRVRAEVFDWQGFSFTGTFPPDCQGHSVPTSLKTLVSMLLNGTNMKHQESTESQVCLTISQLLYFNVRHKAPSAATTRHTKVREPPLPMYLGLNVHTKTRSKVLVNTLHDLGLSVSYDRVLELENSLACAACKQLEEGLVCPAHLGKGLFTVGTLDNNDHNLSSTTA